jgi:hypothetical protein
LREDGKVVRQVSGIQKIVFNTDVFPEGERFAAYREELAKWSCGLELSTPDPLDFHANLELRRVGSLEIMISTLSAIEVARTPRLVQDGDDALLLMLLLDGEARQSQLGDQQLIHAGQAVIFDSGCPGAFSLVSGSKLLTLKIPRAKLSVRLPQVSRWRSELAAGCSQSRDGLTRRPCTGQQFCERSKRLRPIRPLTQASRRPGSGSRCAMSTTCWRAPGELFPNIWSTGD